MFYRQQHVGKVTASVETGRFKRVLNLFTNKFPVVDESCYNANLAFYTFFRDELDNHQIHLFEQYFLFYKTKLLFKRLYIIIQNNFNIGNSILTLCVKVVLRPIRN